MGNDSNSEAEKAVICAVTMREGHDSMKAWATLVECGISPLSFHEQKHQIAALVISELWSRGKPVDGMSVFDGLCQVSFGVALDALDALKGKKPKFRLEFTSGLDDRDKALCAVGADSLVTDSYARDVKTLKHLAHIIVDHYRQRMATETLESAVRRLKEPSGRTELRVISDYVNDQLVRILGGRSGTKSIERALEGVMEQHAEAKAKQVRPLPAWPLAPLEKMCRFRDGSFVVLAATTGGGKTSLALQTATATAQAIKMEGCVGIISREMTSEDLARILVSRETGITVEQMERGELDEEQMGLMAGAAEKMGGGKAIVMCDSLEKLGVREVCTWARQQHTATNGNLRLLIVDHLGLLDGENPRQTDYEKITAATRALKVLAIDLKIVVLALCQLNKDGQRRQQGARGNMESMEARYGKEDFTELDLKGSGSIAHDADQIVFICKQGADGDISLPVNIKVAKNRWGSKGQFPATFKKADGQRFVEVEPRRTDRQERMSGDPRDGEDVF